MAGRNVPLVLIPRFTSYIGTGNFYTAPIAVSAFDTVVINAWRGAAIGTNPVVNISFEESNDCVEWAATEGDAAGQLPPQVETQYEETLSKAWFRIGIALSGTNPAATVYALGFLQLRER